MKRIMIMLFTAVVLLNGCVALSLSINTSENDIPQSGSRYGTKWYLDSSGDLYTWGYDGCNTGVEMSKYLNTSLGQGDNIVYNNIPKKVYENVKFVSWASYFGLTTDGDMIMWGDPYVDERVMTKIETVRCGNIAVMKDCFYITEDKKLFARYDVEHIGQSKPFNGEDTLLMDNVADSATISSKQLVLKDDGSLWAFMMDYSTLELAERPKEILTGVKKIINNTNSALFLREDDSLWFYGDNETGQAGNGKHGDLSYTTRDCMVTNTYEIMKGVTEAWISDKAAFAVTEEGDLYGWGLNDYDLMLTGGNYTTPSDNERNIVTRPILIMTDIKDTFCNNETVMFVIKTDGSVWSWGLPESGVLGHEILVSDINRTNTSCTPKKILDGVKRICGAGGTLIFAEKTDGSVWYWGNDSICVDSEDDWDIVLKNADGEETVYIKQYNIPSPIEFSVDTYFQTALDYIVAQTGEDVSQYEAVRYIDNQN